MEFFPPIRLGIRNGWLLLAILYGIFGILLWIFSSDVVKRLYDKSGWKKRNIPYIVTGKLFSLSALILLVLTPLQVGETVFLIGITLYALATAGFIAALFTYSRTPLDQPVTGGLYRISRNPQIAMLVLAFLGVAIAVGSWTAVILILIGQIFHYFFLIREEERACMAHYGDAYRTYMEDVPRTFLFF